MAQQGRMAGQMPNVRPDGAQDVSDAVLVVQEGNVLFPRETRHDAQATLRGQVHHPRWRGRVGADGVQPCPRHGPEVLLHLLRWRELLTIRIRLERQIGRASCRERVESSAVAATLKTERK